MDEKKKLMVLGAMGVVLLGIGVWQFTKSSGNQPAPAPATTVAKTDASDGSSKDGKANDQTAQQQNDLVKGAYASRDPFKPLVDPNAPTPAVNNLANTTPNTRPVRLAQNTIPPFPGAIEKPGLPDPTAVASANGGKTVPVNPPAPAYGYALAGVIMGRKPMAVFVDAQGGQHLVSLGGSLDGDTQLVGLERDHVVIRVKGQNKNLTLGGGDSSAK